MSPTGNIAPPMSPKNNDPKLLSPRLIEMFKSVRRRSKERQSSQDQRHSQRTPSEVFEAQDKKHSNSNASQLSARVLEQFERLSARMKASKNRRESPSSIAERDGESGPPSIAKREASGTLAQLSRTIMPAPGTLFAFQGRPSQ